MIFTMEIQTTYSMKVLKPIHANLTVLELLEKLQKAKQPVETFSLEDVALPNLLVTVLDNSLSSFKFFKQFFHKLLTENTTTLYTPGYLPKFVSEDGEGIQEYVDYWNGKVKPYLDKEYKMGYSVYITERKHLLSNVSALIEYLHLP